MTDNSAVGGRGHFLDHQSAKKFATKAAGLVLWYGAVGLGISVILAWALAALLPHHSLTKSFDIIPLGENVAGESVHIVQFSRGGMSRRQWCWAPTAWQQEMALSRGLSDQQVRKVRQNLAQWRAWGEVGGLLADGRSAPFELAVEDARGWPRLALWSTLYRVRTGLGPMAEEASGGFRLPARFGVTTADTRVLPYRPLWEGLGTDTLFWGLSAWAVAAGFTGLRIVVRRWLRRCPVCGYDLRGAGASGCPECGWGRPTATIGGTGIQSVSTGGSGTVGRS